MEVLVYAKIAVESIDREMSPTASAIRTIVVDIFLIIHNVQQELLILSFFSMLCQSSIIVLES